MRLTSAISMKPAADSFFNRTFLGMVFGAALTFVTTQAQADDMDVSWDDSFFLSASGFDNPLTWVGFNPCPEPPKPILLSNPTEPSISLPAVRQMQVLFAISDDVPLQINAPGAPDDKGHFAFEVLSGAGAPLFDVFFDVFTDSGGVPMNWVAFNPVPGPPFLPGAGADWIGFNFDFTMLSEATLSMQIMQPGGTDLLSFSLVPEPTSLVLLGIGLVALGFAQRRPR